MYTMSRCIVIVDDKKYSFHIDEIYLNRVEIINKLLND